MHNKSVVPQTTAYTSIFENIVHENDKTELMIFFNLLHLYQSMFCICYQCIRDFTLYKEGTYSQVKYTTLIIRKRRRLNLHGFCNVCGVIVRFNH